MSEDDDAWLYGGSSEKSIVTNAEPQSMTNGEMSVDGPASGPNKDIPIVPSGDVGGIKSEVNDACDSETIALAIPSAAKSSGTSSASGAAKTDDVSAVEAINDDDDDDSDDDVEVHIGQIKGPGAGGASLDKSLTLKSKESRAPVKGVDVDKMGKYQDKPIIEYDFEKHADDEMPWRKPGADITDFFNYGFNEDTWMMYCNKQRQMKTASSGLAMEKLHGGHIGGVVRTQLVPRMPQTITVGRTLRPVVRIPTVDAPASIAVIGARPTHTVTLPQPHSQPQATLGPAPMLQARPPMMAIGPPRSMAPPIQLRPGGPPHSIIPGGPILARPGTGVVGAPPAMSLSQILQNVQSMGSVGVSNPMISVAPTYTMNALPPLTVGAGGGLLPPPGHIGPPGLLPPPQTAGGLPPLGPDMSLPAPAVAPPPLQLRPMPGPPGPGHPPGLRPPPGGLIPLRLGPPGLRGGGPPGPPGGPPGGPGPLPGPGIRPLFPPGFNGNRPPAMDRDKIPSLLDTAPQDPAHGPPMRYHDRERDGPPPPPWERERAEREREMRERDWERDIENRERELREREMHEREMRERERERERELVRRPAPFERPVHRSPSRTPPATVGPYDPFDARNYRSFDRPPSPPRFDRKSRSPMRRSRSRTPPFKSGGRDGDYGRPPPPYRRGPPHRSRSRSRSHDRESVRNIYDRPYRERSPRDRERYRDAGSRDKFPRDRRSGVSPGHVEDRPIKTERRSRSTSKSPSKSKSPSTAAASSKDV